MDRQHGRWRTSPSDEAVQAVARVLGDDVNTLTESGGKLVGRVLTLEEQDRLLKTAEANAEWEHVYCAAILAANMAMPK